MATSMCRLNGSQSSEDGSHDLFPCHDDFIDDHFRSITRRSRDNTVCLCKMATPISRRGRMKSTLALSAALILSAVLVAPQIAAAAGEENPPPPTNQDKNKGTQSKKKKDKSSSA